MRRFFVTGATGALGRALCQRLGAAATGCGRNVEVGKWLGAQGTRFVPLDIRDTENLSTAMSGHEVVFHCAAFSSAWGKAEDFRSHNVAGTGNVLAAARKAGVRRVVFISSPSIYFDFHDRENIREDEPLPAHPVNAYAASKREAEVLVLAAVKQGLDAVILRPRGIIGPWDQALAPRLARVARRGIVPLPGGGRALVDVTCVANLIDAMIAVAEAGTQISGRVYNISNGAPVTVKELLTAALNALGLPARLVPVPTRPALAMAGGLECLAQLTGGWEPLVTRYSLGLLGYSQTLDISAAQHDLNWTPKMSLTEGLAILGRWWQEEHAHAN